MTAAGFVAGALAFNSTELVGEDAESVFDVGWAWTGVKPEPNRHAAASADAPHKISFCLFMRFECMVVPFVRQ